MSHSEGQRRLVAILFSDIVGYTEKMGRDEDRTIVALAASRQSQAQLIEKFHGTWVQSVGDGVLCFFESAVEATNCAIEIQRSFSQTSEISLRIGIHVGDVVIRQSDDAVEVFGDAVNVAARIQGESRPGGICVSERIYEDLLNQPGLSLEVLKLRHLKGVSRAVRLYHVADAASAPLLDARVYRRIRHGAIACACALVVASLLFQFGRYDRGSENADFDVATNQEPATVEPDPAEFTAAASVPEVRDSPQTSAGLPGQHTQPAVAIPAAPGSRTRLRDFGATRSTTSEAVPAVREPEREAIVPTIENVEAIDEPLATQTGATPGEAPATTVGPVEIVDQTIREVLKVLQTKGIPNAARLRQIEHIAYARFDFETICRNVIGHHWRRFTRAEREEFIRGFEVLLAQRYSDKLELYDQQRVELLESFGHARGDISVLTAIVGDSGKKTRVDYRLRGTAFGDPSQSSEARIWRVIDVAVEGVSIVANYRAQFESILADRKPEDLLIEVRRKISVALGSRKSPGTRTSAEFEKIRKTLLDAWGPWQQASARVWVESSPVASDARYRVHFEADCDCDALLFAIHDFTDRISLVYSSAVESSERLTPQQPAGVWVVPAPEIGEFGGYGRETLKLFVTSKDFKFAGLNQKNWEADPRLPRRVDELERFLAGLDSSWDSAVAFVEVVR
jgi:class 3 adenylate cyclase/ABC-type transporter MlaC component